VSNKIKYLVTSGCSFTHDSPTWANYLASSTNKTLYNVAMSGAGNHLISTFLIKKIEELLSAGIKKEEICAIIQWSGIFRFDRIVEKKLSIEDSSMKERPVHIANKVKERSFSSPSGTTNDWVMCAGSRNIGIWPELYYITSKEQAFLETLENILRAQWYLKSKQIKYKMFTGWDIFTDGLPQNKFINYSVDAETNSINQFTEKEYQNINNFLLKENCKWSGYLFDLIDWDNFWVHESERIKYGGLTQWVADNLPKELWFCAPGNGHPSSKAHEKFAEHILRKP